MSSLACFLCCVFPIPKAGVDAELPKAGVEDAPNAGVDEPVANIELR